MSPLQALDVTGLGRTQKKRTGHVGDGLQVPGRQASGVSDEKEGRRKTVTAHAGLLASRKDQGPVRLLPSPHTDVGRKLQATPRGSKEEPNTRVSSPSEGHK